MMIRSEKTRLLKEGRVAIGVMEEWRLRKE